MEKTLEHLVARFAPKNVREQLAKVQKLREAEREVRRQRALAQGELLSISHATDETVMA